MTNKETIIICPNNNLKNYILKLQHERDKYKQALDEIKNIVTDDDSLIQDYEIAYDLGVVILDIINKAKEK